VPAAGHGLTVCRSARLLSRHGAHRCSARSGYVVEAILPPGSRPGVTRPRRCASSWPTIIRSCATALPSYSIPSPTSPSSRRRPTAQRLSGSARSCAQTSCSWTSACPDGRHRSDTPACSTRDGRAEILILTTFDLDEYVYDALRAGPAASCSRTAPQNGSFRARDRGRRALLAPAVTRRLIDEFAMQNRPPEGPVTTLRRLTPRRPKSCDWCGRSFELGDRPPPRGHGGDGEDPCQPNAQQNSGCATAPKRS